MKACLYYLYVVCYIWEVSFMESLLLVIVIEIDRSRLKPSFMKTFSCLVSAGRPWRNTCQDDWPNSAANVI